MYAGKTIHIPFGLGSLQTDDKQSDIPPTNPIVCENVTFSHGYAEKDFGAKRWNSAALPGGIVGIFDWWPNQSFQRLIVCCKDGKVYRYINPSNFSEVLPEDDAPTILTWAKIPWLVEGGNEDAGNNKKLFIFSGNNPVQVIDGDSATRRDISGAPSDWDGVNQPTFGIQHRNRMFAFGNRNNPHAIYASSTADQEDFNNNALLFLGFPGEGQKFVSAKIFKGRLFFFKYPFGVYYLEDSDPDSANWFIARFTGAFGIASANSALEVLDDMIVANSSGSITSLNATNAFGDIQQGDLLFRLRNKRYLSEHIAPLGTDERQALFYESRSLAMFTYRSKGGIKNDRILIIDYSNPQVIRTSWNKYAQANCLGLRRDIFGVPRPFYGSDDGYVYEMDRKDREVAGEGYELVFETPQMDFGFIDPTFADQNKIFQFLEIEAIPCGNWNLSVDVFIDNKFSETIQFSMGQENPLDLFVLDTDRLGGEAAFPYRKPLHGSGRRISFRMYNSGYKQNVKIAGINIGLKPSAQQQKTK